MFALRVFTHTQRSGRAETHGVVMIFKTAGPTSWPFAPFYKNHQKGQKTFGPKEQDVFESVSEGNKSPD